MMKYAKKIYNIQSCIYVGMGCGKRETGVRKKADYKILFQQLVDYRENLKKKDKWKKYQFKPKYL